MNINDEVSSFSASNCAWYLAIKKLQWNPTYKLDKWFEEEVFNK